MKTLKLFVVPLKWNIFIILVNFLVLSELMKSVTSISSTIPPLQLESSLQLITNVLQDRNYLRMYDESLPKNNLKGKSEPTPKLDQGIVPIHYSIFLRPILDETGVTGERFTAPGIVKIIFKSQKSTKEIFIHAVEITIHDEFVLLQNLQKDGMSHNIEKRELSEPDSLFKITLNEPLEIDQEYQLTISFTSLVSKQRLSGLYLSNYTDPVTKELKYMATTQFESIHARKCFPCFDEPQLKATFDVSLGRKLEYNSISNMEISHTSPIIGLKGWVWDHYQTSVKMSTYLLAFIVSDFKSAQADLSLYRGKPVKTWAKPEEAQYGAYPSKVAARVLSFYEDYFKTEYPLPKMDSIAVANEHFAAGAMENFGANTYRAKYLLHYGNKSTEADRYTINSIISHEIGHQWFGNLVTCKNWNSLWLNEGFATYVSYLGVGAVAPEFKPRDLFFTESVQKALQTDTRPDTHPVVNSSNPTSTGEFDKITYKKGSCLISMMEGFLGERALKAGLHAYLKKFSFGNVMSDDLFLTLDEEARKINAGSVRASGIFGLEDKPHLSVKDIMDSYIYKSGYPLIRVRRSLSSASGYTTFPNLIISQERFVEGKRKNDTVDNYTNSELWWVPISVKSSIENPLNNSFFDDHKPNFWLSQHTLARQWSLLDSIKNNNNNHDKDGVNPSESENQSMMMNLTWLLVNPMSKGYYRVIYDDHLTLLLQKQLSLNPKVFPPVARAKIIDDYFNAANAEYISMETALGFTSYLEKEYEYVVWSTTFLNIKKIYNMMRSGRSFDNFNAFFRTKVSSVLDKIGLEQKPQDKGSEVLLRSHLMDWACNLEHVGCTQMAKRLLHLWIRSEKFNPIPADIQPVMYCTAVATSDNEEIWNFLWRKYQETEDSFEKFKLIGALCCSRERKLLGYLMEEALRNNSKIRKSDASVALQRLAANTLGNEMVYEKLKRDFDSVITHFGGSKQIAYALNTLSFYWNQESQLKDFKEFVETHSDFFKPIDKLMKSSVQIIEDNIHWMNQFNTKVSSWFEMKVKEEIQEKMV